MSELEKVAELDEIADGERKSVFIDETPALLVRCGDEYLAVEDTCSHDGQPLTDGEIIDCRIECPRHGAQFDLRTGAPLSMPATEGIAVFRIEVREDGIYAGPG